jgi:O-antigen/teichoic acid export membrane protein
MTTSRRLARALVAVVAGRAGIVLGSALLVPMYLSRWTPGLYGEWLAISSIAAYLSTLDLGMSMAGVNRLTRAHARGDDVEYVAAHRAAMSFYLAMAAAGTLALGLVVFTTPFTRWIGLTEMPAWQAMWATWLLGVAILWAMPSGLIAASYRITGDLARSEWVANVQQAFGLSLAAAVLVAGGGPVVIALTHVAGVFLVTACVAIDVARRHPGLLPSWGRPRSDMLWSLVRPGLMFLLVTAAGAIALQGSVLVISTALGGAAVAVFVTTRTLAHLGRHVVGALTNVVWPELTRLDALNELSRLRRLHALLVAASSALCIACAATLYYVGADIISRWTLGALTPDPTLLALLLLLVVAQSPWMVSLIFSASTNRHARTATYWFLGSVLGLAFAAVLVKPLGAWGVPIGLILGEAVGCYHFVMRDTCRMLGEDYWPFARKTWTNLAVSSVAAVGIAGFVHSWIGGPVLVRWAAIATAAGVASTGTAWLLWLTPLDRAHVIRRVRRSPRLTVAETLTPTGLR